MAVLRMSQYCEKRAKRKYHECVARRRVPTNDLQMSITVSAVECTEHFTTVITLQLITVQYVAVDADRSRSEISAATLALSRVRVQESATVVDQ
jgi:hypothetical protein